MKKTIYSLLLSAIFSTSSLAVNPAIPTQATQAAPDAPELILPPAAVLPAPPVIPVPAATPSVEELYMGAGMVMAFGVLFPLGLYSGLLAF